MTRNKKGRAAQAARYRAMAAGASAPRQQNQQQNIASRFAHKATPAHSFSLADEARNTASNHSFTDKAGNLRTRPVVFVSAGVVEPLKELEELDIDPVKPDAFGFDEIIDNVEDSPVVEQIIDPSGQDQRAVMLPPSTAGDIFFVDTTGDQNLTSRQTSRTAPVPIPDHSSPDGESDSSEDVVLFRGRNSTRRNEPLPVIFDEIVLQVEAVETTMQNITLDTGTAVNDSRRASSPPSPKPWQLRGHNDEDAIVADYIANMANDDDDDDASEDDPGTGKKSYKPFSLHSRDLGGSDGDVVIPEDSESDDSSADVNDNDKNSGDPDVAEAEGFASENDVDDEALARLLAKQEELGLDDEDLVLFDGEGSGVSSPTSRKAKLAAKQDKSKKKTRNQIPTASAVADVFDELDLMDWDRRNLPRQPKSKRGQPNFNISDSELEATLDSAWQKDRLRKKERKKEREELRAQGLLGKHADPKDSRVKYPRGISFDQIKEEMERFLRGTDQIFTFPPMDAHARKTIHELAIKFNIKSKSVGRSEDRRTTLHRTLKTDRYNEVYFEKVFARSGRKYFPRLDVKGKGPKQSSGGGRGGRGVSHAAFSYKDGEVVGGSAPELGESNKGRTMLEKMGWSTGMALGAMDNKGILQPVVHVVKKSKAGLG